MEVTTPVYEGPFDLLLHLCLRDEVSIYEVGLADIVDAYIAELDAIEQFDLEVATEFLLIAATLVELKSRSLLPGNDDVGLDEDLGLWEERDLLLARLLECKTFKDAATVLRARLDEGRRYVARTTGPDERFASLMPDLLAGVQPTDLRTAFLRVVTRPVPRVDLEHVAPIRASVTDAVAELVTELPRLGRTSFRALTAGQTERLEIVIRFLALLELFKQGLVDLEQARTFGEINVVWTGVGEVDLAGVEAYDG